MVIGNINLAELLARMASRDDPRTEANVQADLHAFLLAAPLSLHDDDLEDLEVTLEKQAGARRRIDVEAGLCVFEVKRDLRIGNVREDAIDQLKGYVVARTKAMQRRYVGVVTDGAEWRLYHLLHGELWEASQLQIDPTAPDVNGLTVWLESVLSTVMEIAPTPAEIEGRLGSRSPAHRLDYAELSELYAKHRNVPTVQLKRELWARLLTTAFGTGFTDSDELFVEHTLLVATAEIIAHSVIGLDPNSPDIAASAVVTGQLFASAQVHGVVEADFFDWIVEVEGGERFVKMLARRVARFAWRNVEHDVLKVLYESVISTAQRKQLGEYYTPDWLADQVVASAVSQPLKQRVLDPACGSGTFLFHAIRRYLASAASNGVSDAKALVGVTQHVIGMDIHPVAVTFARVTYLLAIGPDRLQAPDRPTLSIPVYLGDSIQWGQDRSLFTAGELVIPTGGNELWARELRFPEAILDDAARFDRLIADLSDLASAPRKPRTPAPSPKPVLRRFGVDKAHEKVLTSTYDTLCQLHDGGHDHIWGYYVRNLARPVWLTRAENRVDVLVGNPPWLSYRFMTKAMQVEFKRLSEQRGLWAGAAVATHQDLSGVFVLRSIERYLRVGGQFAFVMPWSVLRARQWAGFRSGKYGLEQGEGLYIEFGQPWDLHAVKPTFFPVPSCVIAGSRSEATKSLPATAEKWSGRLERVNVSWESASMLLKRSMHTVRVAVEVDASQRSPYHSRFAQGATLVPRLLTVVEEQPAGPLGAGQGRVVVSSRRSANEKLPWKNLATLTGSIERQFVHKLHLGETLLPYRMLDPLRAVVPWDGHRLLDAENPDLGLYPGLMKWCTQAEELWEKHRSSDRLTLKGQFDFRSKLKDQFPFAPFRVVYNKSGMYLAAAVVRDHAVLDHSLYWGVCITLAGARYLEAILNSRALTQRLRPLQSKGQHNPRDYHKFVWQVPIPEFDKTNPIHARLVDLAAKAESIASEVQLPEGRRFETLRRIVRDAVHSSDVGEQIEVEVGRLLSS